MKYLPSRKSALWYASITFLQAGLNSHAHTLMQPEAALCYCIIKLIYSVRGKHLLLIRKQHLMTTASERRNMLEAIKKSKMTSEFLVCSPYWPHSIFSNYLKKDDFSDCWFWKLKLRAGERSNWTLDEVCPEKTGRTLILLLTNIVKMIAAKTQLAKGVISFKSKNCLKQEHFFTAGAGTF